MKITFNTKDFTKALDKASKVALSSKTSTEILNTIKIEISNNKCSMMAFNLEQAVIATTEIINGDDTSFILSDVKQLLKALKYFKDDIIEIISDNDNYTISCGRKKVEQKISYDVSDFPSLPEWKCKDEYIYNIKSLIGRYNNIKHAASVDSKHIALQGIHFNEEDMVACDGFRMAVSKGVLIVSAPFTVPIDVFKYASLLEGDIKIGVGKFIEIKDDNTIIWSRIYSEDYVDYKRVIPSDNDIKFVINAKEYTEELKYLKEFTDSGKRVTWKGDGLLESKNDKGIYKTEVNIDVQSGAPNLDISFNCEYMIDALSQFKDKDVIYSMKSKYSPIIIEDKEGANLSLILPVRV